MTEEERQGVVRPFSKEHGQTVFEPQAVELIPLQPPRWIAPEAGHAGAGIAEDGVDDVQIGIAADGEGGYTRRVRDVHGAGEGRREHVVVQVRQLEILRPVVAEGGQGGVAAEGGVAETDARSENAALFDADAERRPSCVVELVAELEPGAEELPGYRGDDEVGIRFHVGQFLGFGVDDVVADVHPVAAVDSEDRNAQSHAGVERFLGPGMGDASGDKASLAFR